MNRYITIILLLSIFNASGQIDFALKKITSGHKTDLVPLVDFQYDSVQYLPDMGSVSKLKCGSMLIKNGVILKEKSIKYKWEICESVRSTSTYLVSIFYRQDSVVGIDTSIFEIVPYPIKKFYLSYSSNITQAQKERKTFNDTTWKNVLRTEGELIKRINTVEMKDFDSRNSAKYYVKSFTLSIHKKNGKVLKEIPVIGRLISDDINQELRRYKSGYLMLTNIYALLECGVEIESVSTEKIELNLIE